MKKFKIYSVLLILCSASVFLNAQEEVSAGSGEFDSDALEIPAGEMLLSQAFEIALKNNPSIDQVAERISNAEAVIKRAKSYLYPSLVLGVSHQYGNATKHPDWLTSVRVSADFNQTNAGMSFKWKLFDGLQDIHYLRAARKGLESAKQQHLEAQRILRDQVSQAFIRSELAKEQMRIAKSHYQFNQTLEADAQLRFEVGQIPEADVLNFSMALIQAEASFESSKRDYQIACTVIAQLLSIEGSTLPQSLLPKADLSDIDGVVQDFDDAFNTAVKLRPDLYSVRLGIEAMAHQEQALEGRFFPSFSLFGGFRYTKVNDLGLIDQDEHDSNIGLRMDWSLFDGGRRKAQILEMRSSKNELFHKERLLLDSISSEIRQQILSLESAYVLLEKSEKAESYARKIRDFVEKSYISGSSSITRLNEAQNNWIKTSSTLSAARLQILLNQYRLKTATGEILN